MGNTFENDVQKLFFNGTAIAGIADNAASSPLTSLYVALHTADPGEAGDQTTSEIAYTGYVRAAVARSTSGFTVTANSVSPAASITFPACTNVDPLIVTTAKYFSFGTAPTGAGKLLYSGTITPNINVSTGVTPYLTTGSTVTQD